MEQAVEGDDGVLIPSDASLRYNSVGVQRFLGGAVTAEDRETGTPTQACCPRPGLCYPEQCFLQGWRDGS